MKTFFKWLLIAYVTCTTLPSLFFFFASLSTTAGVAAAFAYFFAAFVVVGVWLLQFFIPIGVIGAFYFWSQE